MDIVEQNVFKANTVKLSFIGSVCKWTEVGKLKEHLEVRTGTALDAGNFRGSCSVAKDKLLKICTFVKDRDVNDLSFLIVMIPKSNDFLYTKEVVESLSLNDGEQSMLNLFFSLSEEDFSFSVFF